MPIHRIAPLAVGLALAPSAFAQNVDGPPQAERQGQWYVAASGAIVDGAEYSYDTVLFPGLLTSANTVTTDAGAAIEAALGYAFSSGIRTEAALTLQQFGGAKTDTIFLIIDETPPLEIRDTFRGGDIRSASLNLNAYYDFPTGGSMQPYVGLGAGIVSVEIDDGVIDAKDPGISLQAMVGLSIKISKSTSFHVEGRWQQLSDLTTRGFDLATSLPISVDFDFSTLSIRSGLRLTF